MQAELLADDREDVVGVRVGHPAVLRGALPEPDAEDAAGGERVQALDGVVAGALRVLERIGNVVSRCSR